MEKGQNDFNLQKKVASERFLAAGLDGYLRQELVFFKFKLFAFLRCDKKQNLSLIHTHKACGK